MLTEKNHADAKYKLCQLLELKVDSSHRKIKYSYKKSRKQLLDEYFKERLEMAWKLYLTNYNINNRKTQITGDRWFFKKLLIGLIIAGWTAYTMINLTQLDEWSGYLIAIYTFMSIMAIGFPWSVMFWIKHELVHHSLKIPFIGIYTFLCLVTILSTFTVPYFTITTAMKIIFGNQRA